MRASPDLKQVAPSKSTGDVLPRGPYPAACRRSRSSSRRSRRRTQGVAGGVRLTRGAAQNAQICCGSSRSWRNGASPPPQLGHLSRRRQPWRQQETRVARLQPRRKYGVSSFARQAGQNCSQVACVPDAQVSRDLGCRGKRSRVQGSGATVRAAMGTVKLTCQAQNLDCLWCSGDFKLSDVAPRIHGCGTEFAKVFGCHLVAGQVKQVGNRVMNGDEAL